MTVAKRLIGPQLTKDIIGKEGLREQNKRDEVFEKWLEMKGPKATYRELVNIFEKLKDIEAAEAVRKLATSYAQSDSTGKCIDIIINVLLLVGRVVGTAVYHAYASDLPNWCALYIRGVVFINNMHNKQKGILTPHPRETREI